MPRAGIRFPLLLLVAGLTGDLAGGRPAPAVAAAAGPRAGAQSVDGRDLAQRSSGVARGEAWVLVDNGFAGSYLTVARPGLVTLTVRASAIAGKGGAPRMNVVVGDHLQRFDVTAAGAGTPPAAAGASAASVAGASDYTAAVTLPAGTYFARIEYVNDTPHTARELWIHRLTVAGAKLLPRDGGGPAQPDAAALAAADTYVRNFRRGTAAVTIAGARTGAQARVELLRHAFNFGVNIPFATNKLIPVRVEPGSDAERYQRMILDGANGFNTVVLSNGGKWLYHEPARDQVDLSYVDRFLDFAAEHGLRARMHTMLWDTEQQPAWVVSEDPARPGLLTRAARFGDDRAKADLAGEIDERIDDYVRKRAARYFELDVVNESVHRGRYWKVYGPAGFADIFARTARAVKACGGKTRLFLNEYDLLQSSTDPLGGGADPAGNWYRRHADEVLRAGAPVDGLGVQYYVDGDPPEKIGSDAHSPARMALVLRNLAGTGLRLTLTEFNVNHGTPTPERAADIVEQTARLAFGTREMDTFMIWAIWPRAAVPPPASVLYDDAGALTPAGVKWQALMNAWRTDVTLPVAAGGTVTVTGFYGDYAVTVDGKRSCFALVKGASKAEAGACPATAAAAAAAASRP